MIPLRLALLADGGSDRALLPIVAWHLRRSRPEISLAPIGFRRHDGGDLALGMRRLFALERPDILLVHRDAEREAHAVRLLEIPPVEPPLLRVRVVPVRMTEAWLLLEERAIRIAAQNPNGRMPLELPKVQRLESVPDPKTRLHELILLVSEAKGPRRRRRVERDLPFLVHVLADSITDFEPLDQLPAFRAFTDELDHALESVRPRAGPSDP